MSEAYTAQRHPHLPELDLPTEHPAPDEPFRTLIGVRSDRKTDPFDVLIELRRGIESLPETASTFRLRQVVDDPMIADVVEPETLALCGTWPVPQRVAGGSSPNKRRYVNPAASDSWHYSPVYTLCECGALVSAVDPNLVGDSAGLPALTEHAADCARIDRWRARYELLEHRRHLAIMLIRYGHRTTEIGHHLGYRSRRPGSRMSVDLGIDTQRERRVFERKVALTAAEVLDTYPPEQIAEAFGGYSTRWLFDHVKTYTDADLRSLAQRRVARRRRGEL